MGCTISKIDPEIVIKIYTLEQKYNALSSRIVKLERIEFISGILEEKEDLQTYNEFEKIKMDIQIIKNQLDIPYEKDVHPEFNIFAD